MPDAESATRSNSRPDRTPERGRPAAAVKGEEMPLPEIEVVPVRSKGDLKAFVMFPWKVYRKDPCWVPPLIGDMMKMLDPARHPFHRHADVQCFLARRTGGGSRGPAGEVVGRIAAFVNHLHNQFHQDRTGFFGFFETLPDPSIPPYLFRAAAAWLRERGMDRMRGPANFSSNEEWGLLTSGFDSSPAVMMTYNPAEYARYLEGFGFVKAKDLVAYYLDDPNPPVRLTRMSERLEKEGRFKIRTLDMKHFDDEVKRVQEVYNSAWEKNWGFVPMTKEEIEHMAKELRPVCDPNLILFAEVDGRTVAFTMALPDLNQALKKANGRLWPFGLVRMLIESKRIHLLRVLTLGVVKEFRRKGVDSLLFLHLYRNGVRRGYVAGEFSWILEDNVRIRRALEHTGARVYKTYRLYDYLLRP